MGLEAYARDLGDRKNLMDFDIRRCLDSLLLQQLRIVNFARVFKLGRTCRQILFIRSNNPQGSPQTIHHQLHYKCDRFFCNMLSSLFSKGTFLLLTKKFGRENFYDEHETKILVAPQLNPRQSLIQTLLSHLTLNGVIYR
jgi:hypothetical protein